MLVRRRAAPRRRWSVAPETRDVVLDLVECRSCARWHVGGPAAAPAQPATTAHATPGQRQSRRPDHARQTRPLARRAPHRHPAERRTVASRLTRLRRHYVCVTMCASQRSHPARRTSCSTPNEAALTPRLSHLGSHRGAGLGEPRTDSWYSTEPSALSQIWTTPPPGRSTAVLPGVAPAYGCEYGCMGRLGIGLAQRTCRALAGACRALVGTHALAGTAEQQLVVGAGMGDAPREGSSGCMAGMPGLGAHAAGAWAGTSAWAMPAPPCP